MIARIKLATKILRGLACTSREAPRQLYEAGTVSKFFDNNSLLVHFRCLGVRSNLHLCMCKIYLPVLSSSTMVFCVCVCLSVWTKSASTGI